MTWNTAIPNYINMFILILIILVASIFFIPVVTVRRLQNHNNIYTSNLCFTWICLSIYFIVYLYMFENAFHSLSTSPTCTLMYYLQNMLTCQSTCALAILSINRYFSVVYPTTRYLKFKHYLRYIVCGQWIIGMILPLPMFARNLPVRELSDLHWPMNASYKQLIQRRTLR